jgi:hypothetical protein
MSIKYAFCGWTTLICLVLLSGCKRQQPSGPHLLDGTYWMSWSSPTRDAFVESFIDGYIYGANDTCQGADRLWHRDFEPENPAEKELPSDMIARCNSHFDGFNRSRLSLDKSIDLTPYTDPITAFYKNHPDRQYVPIDDLLLGLRDSNYDKAVVVLRQKGDDGWKGNW